MKYYLIAGEASGDLHASNLMKELKKKDGRAEFRFIGGEKMEAIGGTLVKHYRELAYMGFIPVLLHLRTILRNMKMCKEDVRDWKPDVLILVDYPGFNLKIAEYVHRERICKVFYYISPKIWAWKEHRIKTIRRDVDELFSILPFEVKWFAERNYKVHYVGNPCVDAVYEGLGLRVEGLGMRVEGLGLRVEGLGMRVEGLGMRVEGLGARVEGLGARVEGMKQIAILAGSRRQEIKDNLGMMLEAASTFKEYKMVLAGAPNIEREYYERYIPKGVDLEIRYGETYKILRESAAALVTSGTATLETAILRVPQVVCYYIPFAPVVNLLRKLFLKVEFFSLVNLIAGRQIVEELTTDRMTVENIRKYLADILPGGHDRERMLKDYEEMNRILGGPGASERAAEETLSALKGTSPSMGRGLRDESR